MRTKMEKAKETIDSKFARSGSEKGGEVIYLMRLL